MKKKILGVKIERAADECPDLSFLGEYSMDPDGRGLYVDRRNGTLMAPNGTVMADKLGATFERNEKPFITDFQHTGLLKHWGHVKQADIAKAYLAIRYRGNGGELKPVRNLFQYFGVRGWKTAQTDAEKVWVIDAVYCCLDARRLETAGKDWHMLGIIAKAEVQLTGNLCQTLQSGGLWGIESDSEPKYFAEVEKEQLGELAEELKSVGFKSRAIQYAFRNPLTVNR